MRVGHCEENTMQLQNWNTSLLNAFINCNKALRYPSPDSVLPEMAMIHQTSFSCLNTDAASKILGPHFRRLVLFVWKMSPMQDCVWRWKLRRIGLPFAHPYPKMFYVQGTIKIHQVRPAARISARYRGHILDTVGNFVSRLSSNHSITSAYLCLGVAIRPELWCLTK